MPVCTACWFLIISRESSLTTAPWFSAREAGPGAGSEVLTSPGLGLTLRCTRRQAKSDAGRGSCWEVRSKEPWSKLSIMRLPATLLVPHRADSSPFFLLKCVYHVHAWALGSSPNKVPWHDQVMMVQSPEKPAPGKCGGNELMERTWPRWPVTGAGRVASRSLVPMMLGLKTSVRLGDRTLSFL